MYALSQSNEPHHSSEDETEAAAAAAMPVSQTLESHQESQASVNVENAVKSNDKRRKSKSKKKKKKKRRHRSQNDKEEEEVVAQMGSDHDGSVAFVATAATFSQPSFDRSIFNDADGPQLTEQNLTSSIDRSAANGCTALASTKDSKPEISSFKGKQEKLSDDVSPLKEATDEKLDGAVENECKVDNEECEEEPSDNETTDAASVATRKSRIGVPHGVTVGAMRVAGPGVDDDGEAQEVDSIDDFSFENAPSTRTPSTRTSSVAGSRVEGPLVATRVSDAEADIEAQVQSRMQKLITNAAVPIDVQPTTQDTSSVATKDNSKKKKICIIAVVLLAIVAAVGAGVGVALSRKSTEQVTARAQAFQEFLEPISGTKLKDNGSPQFQALTWLANDDAANMTIGVDSEFVIKTRYVAAVLYYAFHGDAWLNKYRFLSEEDACLWNQRFDDGDHGIACGIDGTVESFQLPANHLIGSIPSEIEYYTNLIDLDLSSNAIDGSIASLVNLTRLENLNCTLNALTGTLPEFLFTRRSLTVIDLDHNRLFGSISDSLGKSSQLRHFWVRNNSLTGTIPSAVGRSWVLASIDLSLNQLTGTIPDFSSSSRVWNLHLDQNKLTGTIPTTIGSLSSLKTFYLAGNGNDGTGIIGRIPSEIGKCQNLVSLDVGRNDIGGTIPSQFGNLMSLERLRLGENNFSGTLPTSIASLPNLSILHVYGNDLTGSLDEFCTIWDEPGVSKTLAANTCGQAIDLECPCCNQCCNIDIFECRLVN